MKRHLLTLTFTILSFSTPLYAQLQGGPYAVHPVSVNGGGTRSMAGPYSLTASTGQDGGIGESSSASYSLTAGFWPAEQALLPVLYVDASATGANDGTSWTDAYTSLQDALADAAGDPRDIWVAKGTYTPDVKSCTLTLDCGAGALSCNLDDKCVWIAPREQTFQLLDGVGLYGGFAGVETSLNERDVSLNETILSGDVANDDVAVPCTQDSPDCDSFGGLCVGGFCIIADNNSENSYHVTIGGADATATLDGFTITAGNANGLSADFGGGMYNGSSSPTVTNCTFSGNSALGDGGGGMYNGSSSPTVTNCTFSRNAAGSGGGMRNAQSSSPTVTNCTFSGNWANLGGGMANGISSPTVTNCTFSGNSAAARGGGMYNVNNSSPTVTNCTFSGNSADTGGGMHNRTNSTPIVTNCTLSGNSTTSDGGGMFNSASNPTVTNCTFSDNSANNGGGMVNTGSNPTVTNCTFNANSGGNGGGMYNSVSSATITDCLFTGNSASMGGGMANASGSHPALTNCTFSGNSAFSNGGGMVNAQSSSPTVTNCTLSGNSADVDGGGVFNRQSSSPTVDNSILWGNVDDANGTVGGPFMDESAQIHTVTGTPVVNYSIVMGGWSGAGGTGIVTTDPLFIDADGADNIVGTEDDNLRLRVGSPAVDEGNNAAVPPDTTDLDGDGNTTEPVPFDLDGNERFVDDPGKDDCTQAPGTCGTAPIVDMGAYEFQPPIFVDASAPPPPLSGRSSSAVAVDPPGSTWATAYTSLRNAMADPRVTGGTVSQIWVAKGTYNPASQSCSVVGDCETQFDGASACTSGLCVWINPRHQTFRMLDGVALYGGFAGGESSLNQRNITLNETILSGDLLGNDVAVPCIQNSPDCDSFGGRCVDGLCIIKNNNTENSYHVVTGSGTDSTATLDGFSITAGNADGDCCGIPNSGGGMYNSTGSPTVNNCTFSGNTAFLFGGGMYNSHSNPTVTNCAFSGNSAGATGGGMNNTFRDSTVTGCTFRGNSTTFDGGGMSNGGGSPTVTNCAFSGNSAGNKGGGMFNGGGIPTVTNCTFGGNSAGSGGGMGNQSSNPAVTNCTFSGNTANNGGGMLNDVSSPTLANCTFSENSARTDGGGMGNVLADPTIANCVFWGNIDDADANAGGPFMDESAQIHEATTGTPVVNYSIVMGGWSGAGGTGIVTTDPLFIDADGPDNTIGTQDDDLRLQFGSPAIDEGNNAAVPPDTSDLDGDGNTTEPIPFDLAGIPRFIDDPDTVDGGNGTPPIVDMGAYEYFPDCNNNGLPDECDLDCTALGGGCDQAACGLGSDCNTNGIPDACDITDCTPASLDYPGCDDCNLNGVPDSCDIAGATSVDVNLDEVPDECISPNTDGIDWDDPIWNQGNDYPDNDPGNPNGIPNQHVVLRDVGLILNVTVEIDTLTIESGATLCMNGVNPCGALANSADRGNDELNAYFAAASTGDLSLAQAGGLLVEGVLDVRAGRRVDESAALPGAGLRIANGGAVDALNSTIVFSGAIELGSEGQYGDPSRDINNTASLDGASLSVIDETVAGTTPTDITLSGAMKASVNTTLRVRGNSRPLELPPPLAALVVPSVSFRALDSSSYTVGGDFILENVVQLQVGSAGADPRTASMTLGGGFVNHGTAPSKFDWANGVLVLNGTAEQRFEVGGIDVGQCGEGFATDKGALFDTFPHTNFSLGTLQIGTDVQPATVRFVNEFANTAGLEACGEALYVDTLILESGSTVILDNVNVYYRQLVDNGATISLVGCAQLRVAQSSPPTHATLFGSGVVDTKNRFLSVQAGDAGRSQSIRVTWDAMPNWPGGHILLVGQQKWMTQPFQVCENSGNGLSTTPPNCGPSAGQPQKWFWTARLTCDASLAWFGDLAGLTDYCTGSGEACTVDGDCAAGTCGVDGVIHIVDGGIVPSKKNPAQPATFSVQVFGQSCNVSNETNYSDALAVTNPIFGDAGGTPGTCPYSPPNGDTTLIGDVTEAINKFSNLACAPKKTRVDVEPGGQDFKVNFTDVLQILGGFQGRPYPFAAPPACP